MNIPENKLLLKFGLIADSHYADRDPVKYKYYRDSLGKMRACIRDLNDRELDLIIHLGDLKDEDPEPDVASTLEYLRAIEREMAGFAGPRYHLIGNHDLDSITKSQFLHEVENTGIPKDQSYYDLVLKNCHLIFLDANYTEDQEEHFFGKGDMDWTDISVPDFEVKWLTERLKSNTLPKLVFLHHPLYELWISGEKRSYQMHPHNAKELRMLLEESGNVWAVFNGHFHGGMIHKIEGILYYNIKAMSDYPGLENNCYAVVNVFEDGLIEIEGIGRADSYQFKAGLPYSE